MCNVRSFWTRHGLVTQNQIHQIRCVHLFFFFSSISISNLAQFQSNYLIQFLSFRMISICFIRASAFFFYLLVCLQSSSYLWKSDTILMNDCTKRNACAHVTMIAHWLEEKEIWRRKETKTHTYFVDFRKKKWEETAKWKPKNISYSDKNPFHSLFFRCCVLVCTFQSFAGFWWDSINFQFVFVSKSTRTHIYSSQFSMNG